MNLILSLLMTVGVIDVIEDDGDDNAVEISTIVDEKEVECFIRCFSWCIWPTNPWQGPETPWQD